MKNKAESKLSELDYRAFERVKEDIKEIGMRNQARFYLKDLRCFESTLDQIEEFKSRIQNLKK